MANDNGRNELIEISGLWINEGRNGLKYMTGYMGNAMIMIFRNTYKQSDKEPDYRMYICAKRRDSDQGRDEVLSGENAVDVEF